MQFSDSHAFPNPSQLLQSTGCSEEREEGLLGVSVAFCCVSTTLTQDPVATWFRLQTTTMPGMGPLSISPCRPPFVCSKIVPQQVQFLTKEVTAGTLVPRLLGQPLHLKLVANSPEPRQGFVFAKKKSSGDPASVGLHIPAHPQTAFTSGFLVPFCCGSDDRA